MSKIEQLIKELCPNGVEYKSLEKVVKISNGKDHKHLGDGKIPVYGSGGIMRYVNQYIYNGVSVLIPRKGSIGNIFYVDTPFWSVDTIFYTKVDLKKINARFLYHYLLTQNIEKLNTAGGVPSLTKTVLDKISIPLPPLQVQHEIVRILDTFSEYTTELTEELTMRKKQYEYYRDSLLFNNNNQNRVLLKSVVKKSCSGGTPKKNNIEFYLNGTVPWLRTQDVKFNEIHEVNSFITEEAVNKTSAKWIPKNCVIVAISGATAGRCAINKIPTTTNQHCYNMEIDETKALYKYVYYCVCSQYEELLSKKQGTRGDLNSTLILGIEIPIPYPNDREKSLEEQQRIVDILDRFDTLCNDISKGLPAEIEVRKKQYEYYRDKLLSFKEIS